MTLYLYYVIIYLNRKGGEYKIKVNRVERQQITKSHPMYTTIRDYCIRSNNMYNYALYTVRQEFINNGNYLNYHDTQKLLKTSEPYKSLMSQASQCVLQVLDRNWKSYFVAIKNWQKNPHKYLGMPKLPKYRDKGKPFTWFLKNNQTFIEDGKLGFKLKCFGGIAGYKFKTNVADRLIAVRFVPTNDYFTLEIVYEKIIEDKLEDNDRIASIDLGVNNFVTLTNNVGKQPIIINGKGIKSINQYYNKTLARLKNDLIKRNGLHWSSKMSKLNMKRYNRLHNFIHNSSRYIINYCKDNNINTLVLGLNETWKQDCSLGDKVNQNFIHIPYDKLRQQLEYKCLDEGINLVMTKESYTSGTSFLDGELPTKEFYNKSRRIKRGLFQSSRALINSDVNGSLQIMKKVYPNAFSYGLVGNLNPLVINICKI